MFTNDIYYGWQWMGQQWERSLFCQFQLLGSYWKVHWLKLAPGLKKVQWGKPTPPNIFFRPILPNFEKKIEIRDDDFGGWSMLPVRKTNSPKILGSQIMYGQSTGQQRVKSKLAAWWPWESRCDVWQGLTGRQGLDDSQLHRTAAPSRKNSAFKSQNHCRGWWWCRLGGVKRVS